MNHIPLGGLEKPAAMLEEDDVPDSSIGDGMDITIQGANGHVKRGNNGRCNDTGSIRSKDSDSNLVVCAGQMDSLQLPSLDADMSIGRGMDISIRGGEEKECQDDNSWALNQDIKEADEASEDEKKSLRSVADHDKISYEEELSGAGKNVEEVLFDPADDVVVEKCCPQACYDACPCCIGDPDSPFWQLWYKHRLQVSR